MLVLLRVLFQRKNSVSPRSEPPLSLDEDVRTPARSQPSCLDREYCVSSQHRHSWARGSSVPKIKLHCMWQPGGHVPVGKPTWLSRDRIQLLQLHLLLLREGEVCAHSRPILFLIFDISIPPAPIGSIGSSLCQFCGNSTKQA